MNCANNDGRILKCSGEFNGERALFSAAAIGGYHLADFKQAARMQESGGQIGLNLFGKEHTQEQIRNVANSTS